MFVAKKKGTSVRGRHYLDLATKNLDGTYKTKNAIYEEAASSVTGVCSVGSISQLLLILQNAQLRKRGPPLSHLKAAYNLLTSLFDKDDNNENMFMEEEKIERMKISILGIEVDDIDEQISNETKKIIMIEDYIETLKKIREETEALITNLLMKRKVKMQELAYLRANTGSAAEVTDADSTTVIMDNDSDCNNDTQPLQKRAKEDDVEAADDGFESALFRQKTAVAAGLANGNGVSGGYHSSISCVADCTQRKVVAEMCSYVEKNLGIQPHITKTMSCKNEMIIEVLEGEITVFLGDTQLIAKEGQGFNIPPMTYHRGTLSIIEERRQR